MKKSGVKAKSTSGNTMNRKAGKKQAKSNIVLTTLAVAATGILGYLGWQYLRKKKKTSSTSADLNTILRPTTAVYPSTQSYTDTPATPVFLTPVNTSQGAGKATTSSTTSQSNNSFPLKKGSKGQLVKALQQALISKYGVSILPKYGADGDFGSETVAALVKAGLPAVIDESTYYVFVQGSGSATDKSALASKFLAAATTSNLSTVLGLLKQMNTKEDYKQVSAAFSQLRLRGVRQTLVNGLLSSFSKESDKEQIRYQFIRMGLRYNGSTWSLDGIDGKTLITIEPANVWINANERMEVPQKTVLGAEVTKKLDYTLFENKGRYFLVATKSIKYL